MMKKYYFTTACVFVLVGGLLLNAAGINLPAPEGESAPQTNAQITPAMMNGKAAFFKTYNDFKNGKGLNWTYQTYDVGPSFGKLSKYEIVFKTEDGKRQKVATADFWGWRDQWGEVWRNGDFVNGNVTKIPFSVEYVAVDFVLYHPQSPGNIGIEPDEWASENLDSPVITADNFFKKHSKASFEKIKNVKCPQAIGKNGKWDKKVNEDCEKQLPEMIALWCTHMEKNKGIGSYQK